MTYTNEQREYYYRGKNAGWAKIEAGEKVECPKVAPELQKEWKDGYRDAMKEEGLNQDVEWD